jgi:hypothetical protein
MAKHSETLRQAAMVLDQLQGKQTIDAVTEAFERAGLIVVGPDDILALRREKSRKLLQAVRGKYRDATDERPIDMANLFEINDRGEKVEYYRHTHEMNPDEYVQHITYWKDRESYCGKRVRHYYHEARRHLTRRQFREVQQKLPFPVEPETTGA